MLRRITDDTPRTIRDTNPNVPAWLERIVLKLLAKSPDGRYSSATELYTLLEKCLAHVQQPTTVELPDELRLKSRSRKWIALLAVAPICIGMCCGVWWFDSRPPNTSGESAPPGAEAVSLSFEPEWKWDSGAVELESLRRDFPPIEIQTKMLWDVEPIRLTSPLGPKD